jgi:hypothetical protein
MSQNLKIVGSNPAEGFSEFQHFNPEADPTIVSYNASAVKIYKATSDPMRFENKNRFFYFEKTV